MKTLLKILFFFLLAAHICFGQWYQQNSGTTQNLNNVQFVDANTGWAVGDSGLILKTSDAGSSWIPIISGTTENLNDIQFVNTNIGWIVGGTCHGIYPPYSFSAVILKTIDGGSNWFQQMADTTYRLNAVSIINDNTGWAVGGSNYGIPGTILKTTNGGNNWIAQSSGTTQTLSSVHFTDNNTGWAVGGHSGPNTYGEILKTSDGGDNWTLQSTDEYFHSVYFTDSNTGWAIVEYWLIWNIFWSILKTTDGGDSWTIQFYTFEETLTAVHFTDSNTGWVVGNYGRIVKTTNGGTNWFEQPRGTTNHLSSIHFTDVNTGWAVGNSGTILHTTNGGVSFVDDATIQPTEFILEQNYPNPFNPSTVISYQLPVSSDVTLKVYDILGNEVATLVNENNSAGGYEVEFSASTLPSGVYFYQLRAGTFVETKKMILLR